MKVKKPGPLQALELRLTDADRLIEIHEEVTGPGAGRRRGYDTLNRSAIMLAVAAWEGFCEDLVRQTSNRLARNLLNAAMLPTNVRDPLLLWMYEKGDWSRLSTDTKTSIWSLAGAGWRRVYRQYAEAKTLALNTPNYENLKRLFATTTGLSDFAATWGNAKWDKDHYTGKLNDILELRHKIAHGTIGTETVGKAKADRGVELIRRLGAWTAGALSVHETSLRPKKKT